MRPDLTDAARLVAPTWDANRAFTTASVAALLGLLALATAAGAFGGPAAAAEPAATSGDRRSFAPEPPAAGRPAIAVAVADTDGAESPSPSIRR